MHGLQEFCTKIPCFPQDCVTAGVQHPIDVWVDRGYVVTRVCLLVIAVLVAGCAAVGPRGDAAARRDDCSRRYVLACDVSTDREIVPGSCRCVRLEDVTGARPSLSRFARFRSRIRQ